MATAQVEEQQLLKAMSWWDGFVVALANPGFLIAALGFSIGALGTTGAFVLWTISVCLGALQNNIYAELATMFPNKSGGIALFAHEAWRKYFTFVGPIATFGYWFAWSSVLAINGLVVGTLIQAEWFSDSTWAEAGAGFDLNLAILIGIIAIVVVWLFNILGVRPAVWFGYVTGALLMHPGVRVDVPALRHRRVVERQHGVADRRQRRPRLGSHLALLHGLVLVRIRDGGGVCARVPLPRDRYAEGPACVGGVLGGRLRAAAARRRRDGGHRRRSPRTRPGSPSTPRRSTRSSATRWAR